MISAMQTMRSLVAPTVLAVVLGSLCASLASAGEWALIGSRYQGMGGAGVATVNDSFASYWNPAALATAESYDGAINFDAMASVEGDALRAIDDIEEQFDQTDIEDIIQNIEDFGVLPNPSDQVKIDALLAELEKLGESGIGVVGAVSTGLGLRWQRYAVFSRAVAEFAVDPTYDGARLAIDDDTNPNGLWNNKSGARVSGLGVVETGVGYGHSFFDGVVSVGANLKYLRGITYNKYMDYRAIEDAELDFGASDRRRESDNFGLDLGILYQPFDFLRVGMVARNVNSPKFKGAAAEDPLHPGHRKNFKLDAQVRAGAAYYPFSNDFLVIATDLDLTENESDLLDSYKSRLWSFGAEVNVPIPVVSLALRGGGYMNTASGASHAFVFTAGAGLRVWLLSLELSGGVSADRTAVEEGGKKYPSRLNGAAILALSGNF